MLKISIKPSRRLASLLCLVHAAAAGAVLIVDLSIWLKILLLLLISASCGAYLYGPALLRSSEAVVGLEISDDGALSFQTRRGEWCEGTLLGSSFVSPYLTILNIGTEGKFFARHVVIMPDSVHAEDFRRLRVRLRWGGYLRRFGETDTALQMYAGAFDDANSRYARKVLAERSRIEQTLIRMRHAA